MFSMFLDMCKNLIDYWIIFFTAIVLENYGFPGGGTDRNWRGNSKWTHVCGKVLQWYVCEKVLQWSIVCTELICNRGKNQNAIKLINFVSNMSNHTRQLAHQMLLLFIRRRICKRCREWMRICDGDVFPIKLDSARDARCICTSQVIIFIHHDTVFRSTHFCTGRLYHWLNKCGGSARRWCHCWCRWCHRWCRWQGWCS